ncbi:MAG TPA: trigger factor [Candidatus Ratteibacteria bacterium]|nr:trigger factor [Candidatus Ratteibacteria bacterium]
MKVEIIKKSELGRELNFIVEKEVVDETKRKILDEIKKDAEIDGFRKGKAPDDLIEKRYSSAIQEQLLRKLVTDSYINAIKENNLNSIVEPDIYDVKFDDNGNLLFKAYIEEKPDVKIEKYKEIPVKKVKPKEVTEKMVEDVLKEWEKTPEMKVALIDMEKRKAWKEKAREQLIAYSKARAEMEEEKQLWDELMKNIKFPVPEKLVNERAIRYTEEQLKAMNLENKSKEEVEKIAKEIFQKVKPMAEEDVKKYFILEKISELENINVDEKDVEERIEHISRVIGQPYEKVKEQIEKNGEMENLKEEIKIDKTFRFIKENANMIERIILPGEK